MRSVALGIAVLIAVVLLGWYFFGFRLPGAQKRSEISIRGRLFRVDVADTAATRAQGLSGRPGLGEDEGMLFLFGAAGRHGFWMKDMLFPIDIVWMNDGRVVGITERVAPEPKKTIFNLTIYHPPEEADAVLEFRAGTVAREGIAVGDAVRLER